MNFSLWVSMFWTYFERIVFFLHFLRWQQYNILKMSWRPTLCLLFVIILNIQKSLSYFFWVHVSMATLNKRILQEKKNPKGKTKLTLSQGLFKFANKEDYFLYCLCVIIIHIFFFEWLTVLQLLYIFLFLDRTQKCCIILIPFLST